MISCGAPQRTKFHAEYECSDDIIICIHATSASNSVSFRYVADAALDMLATMAEFCEETTGKEVKIKIGESVA